MLFETLHAQAQRLTTSLAPLGGEGELVWYRWGSGPVLVLLHGGTGSWRHWVRNIRFLAESYTVLAADMPGLGESAMAPGPAEPHSVAAALAASLAELLGPERLYDLAGFSFGSNIGTHLAAIEGAHVRSHTIIGAASLGFVAHGAWPGAHERDGAVKRVAKQPAHLAENLVIRERVAP
jgi:pimeloyl-ACP methyl ester carboxylesterase